jgi:hypothetical protein
LVLYEKANLDVTRGDGSRYQVVTSGKIGRRILIGVDGQVGYRLNERWSTRIQFGLDQLLSRSRYLCTISSDKWSESRIEGQAFYLKNTHR